MGGNKRKFSSTRRKNRYFSGNRFTGKKTKTNDDVPTDEGNQTQGTSHKGTRSETKLAGETPEVPESVYNQLPGNRIMDMDILNSVFELLPCPSCNKQMLELNETRRNGLAFDMILQGQGCDWSHVFLNTKRAEHS